MATNTLTRTESSNELFVYRYTQLSGSPEASVTTLTSPVTGYNNSFNESSGQWRVLNLRVDSGDAVLEFGFKNNDANKPLSAICGFTVGLPAAYATHVNTIAKSIAYGFVHSPFTFNDGLYIVHENTLTQVSGSYDVSALRIVIKAGEVKYYSGGTLLLSSIMGISGCPLYVVGALGYADNEITNIGISGASGYTLPIPDYAKELYFLCNGLTSTVPRYPGRLASSTIAQSPLTYLAIRTTAGCTISYPDEEVIVPVSSTNYYALQKPYAAIPFVIKITFNSLTDLTGLQFVNGAIGAGSSLSRSINALTALAQLEIRGCTERRTLGKNNFPINLNSLYLHGNHDIATRLNTMASLTSLRYLEQPSNTTSIFELVAFPNLQLLEIPEGVTWNTSSFESLQNFRLMFNPTRSTTTHGFYGSALASTDHYTLLTNLAIAQQSAALLYGWGIQNSGNNSFISNLSNYSTQASGISGFLFTPSRGDSATIGTNTITLTISSNAGITTDTDNFLTANQFILVKNGANNNSKQLRRISGTPTKSTSGNNITYTIGLQAVKSAVICSGVTVVSGTIANTFVMTGNSISGSIESIRVGDTVRINSVSLPITGTPSIVIAKTANSVTVLKGNVIVNNAIVNDGITSATNATVVFDYEFSGALTNLTSPSDIHISTGTRAIYQYLI